MLIHIFMKKICHFRNNIILFCFGSELYKFIVTLMIFIVFFYFGVNLLTAVSIIFQQ